MHILVTGAAGFIGYHVSKRLLMEGHHVHGIDNLNNYYDVILKEHRKENLDRFERFHYYNYDITKSFDIDEKISHIVHLAAYAGVQYSIDNPKVYELNNCQGTLNILDFARSKKVKNVVCASSSSVYGMMEPPYTEDMELKSIINMYAATKLHNEKQADVYTHLYNMHVTMLRFFTVYGPWGRPDMVIYKWVDAIYNNQPVYVNNHGKMSRSFTYIDDIVNAIIICLFKQRQFAIYNLGSSQCVYLDNLLNLIEIYTGIKANRVDLEAPKGEIITSIADSSKARKEIGFEDKTKIEEGLLNFVIWYKKYKGIGRR